MTDMMFGTHDLTTGLPDCRLTIKYNTDSKKIIVEFQSGEVTKKELEYYALMLASVHESIEQVEGWREHKSRRSLWVHIKEWMSGR